MRGEEGRGGEGRGGEEREGEGSTCSASNNTILQSEPTVYHKTETVHISTLYCSVNNRMTFFINIPLIATQLLLLSTIQYQVDVCQHSLQ